MRLVIINREFRLSDNTALYECYKVCKNDGQSFTAIFIFDPNQITPSKNRFFSERSFELLKKSLLHFRKQCPRLSIFEGEVGKILEEIIPKHKITDIFTTLDYTPYARKRLGVIEVVAKKYGVTIQSFHDHILYLPPKPYRKYTPFYNLCVKNIGKQSGAVLSKAITSIKKTLPDRMRGVIDDIDFSARLTHTKKLQNYSEVRNIPSIDGTTQLSKYMKYGLISIRQLYAIGDTALRRELVWRTFYYQLNYYYPDLLEQSKALQPKFDKIKWISNEQYLSAWCEGKTGYPIVDAGMRQLLTTGWMHNRLRMITASFLVKILHIDWRIGERFFAQRLVDYDPCQNNGGWQWVAGSGADAQPYYRIFNPELQHRKFDPKSIYILTWVPELAELTHKEIIKLYEGDETRPHGYPNRIVDYTIAKKKTIKLYMAIK